VNSNEIQDFSKWIRWPDTAVDQAPASPGTYIFRLANAQQRGRLKGFSDLVYIGAATNLRRGLKNHLRLRADNIDVGWQLERVAKEVGALELAWKELEKQEDPKRDETKLLRQYSGDLIELPPLNRQVTGKKQRDALEALSKLFPGLTPENVRKLIDEVSGHGEGG
jgi:hypothetical protein